METEQLHSFNERLSQWISSQGFWFQLRFSMSGGGASSALYHLLRIAFRLLLFFLLVSLACWYYLLKRVTYPDFPKKLTASIGLQLGSAESRIEGFRRTQGEFNLRRIACVGGPDAFYSAFEAANITCRMGLLDGLTGVWKPGPIRIKRLDMDVRGGADDAEAAGRQAASFLKQFPKFELSTVEISDATLRWGFSDRTKGEIRNSRLMVQRTDEGYRLQFRGGTMSQNWLDRLEIDEIIATIGPKGMKIEKGEFFAKNDEVKGVDGAVSMLGVAVEGGDRPAISGTIRLKHVPLGSLIPARVQGFVEGSISSDLKLFGSTNSADGIGFEGQVILSVDDCITLRDRIHIFRALSVVDVFNSYRKLDFREGSVYLKTSAGVLDVRNVNLKSGDIMTLQGGLRVRLPTQQEIDSAVARRATGDLAPVFATDNTSDDLESKEAGNDFTLKRAAVADDASKETSKDSANAQDSGLFERLAQGRVDRQMQLRGSDLFAKNLRYEGKLQITIPGDSFARAPDLALIHQPDPVTKRISIDVPIEGNIYEITLSQAEDIYIKGRRRD